MANAIVRAPVQGRSKLAKRSVKRAGKGPEQASGAAIASPADEIESAKERIAQSAAILEFAIRAEHDNEEDFDNLRLACRAGWNLLNEASEDLRRGSPCQP